MRMNKMKIEKKHSIFQFSPQVAVESFDDGALILKLTDFSFIELNATARDILEFTDGKNNIHQIAVSLAQEYKIDLEETLKDVSELIQQLSGQGILEPVINPGRREK